MDHELAPRLPLRHVHAQRMHGRIEFNALKGRQVDMDPSKRRTENNLSWPDVNAQKKEERPKNVQRNENQEDQGGGAGPSPVSWDAKENRTYKCNWYFHSRP